VRNTPNHRFCPPARAREIVRDSTDVPSDRYRRCLNVTAKRSHMTFTRLVPFALLMLVAASPAGAQISVNRSVIEFTGTTPVQDVEVVNNGRTKVYLNLSVAEIVDPGSDEPSRVELDDPRTAAVLVSPRQLLVPPGGRKRVRVILREAGADVDRVFRLRVEPYTGKARIADAGGGKKSSAIRVLVGYDLLLFSRPDNARSDLKVTRGRDSIEFRNTGNTNVLLRRIEQCERGAGDDACVELAPNRLYAGERYRVALPKRGSAERFPVKVWKAVGLDNSTDSF